MNLPDASTNFGDQRLLTVKMTFFVLVDLKRHVGAFGVFTELVVGNRAELLEHRFGLVGVDHELHLVDALTVELRVRPTRL